MEQPKPYSIAWYRQQPPDLLAVQVGRYQLKRPTLSQNVKKQLEAYYGNISLDDAQEIDRNLARLLPTYGKSPKVSGALKSAKIVQDLLELVNLAMQKAHDLKQDPYLCDKMRDGILAASCKVNRHYMRKAWGSEEREG